MSVLVQGGIWSGDLWIIRNSFVIIKRKYRLSVFCFK